MHVLPVYFQLWEKENLMDKEDILKEENLEDEFEDGGLEVEQYGNEEESESEELFFDEGQ